MAVITAFAVLKQRRLAFAAIGAAWVIAACSADAGFLVNTWDGRSSYPATAPVYTSDLPFFGPPATPNSDSQGVRTNRIQAQTFDVADKISVEKMYIGYRLNPDNVNVVKMRLLSIPDVGAAYVNPTVLASVDVTTPTPYGGVGERYNALRLDWIDSVPLILEPQDGVAGYALELVGQNPPGGSPNGSPIAWIFRTNNPYAGGRAFELNGTTPNASSDWVLAITGEVVPEPTACLLLVLGAGVCAATTRRRRIS
jgi:hypothetical protein